MIKNNKELKLVIIGLGYVGLPLALEFAKKRKVIGFDIDKKRIDQLKLGVDKNLEFTKNEIKSKKINFTNNKKNLKFGNCFIITVPTPIDQFKKPDLKPLLNSTEMVGKIMKKGDLIIYESTVYPGCVEEKCVPILEKFSRLKFNKDFYCGYSPERINPGDKKRTISKIKKITSGSTPEISNLVDDLYKEIITVGTHKAQSIKVAEAAKVIENTQRDLNIALINELSMLFSKMNIDTKQVLEAAETKWNFLPFMPGLVGGHCIGVDPYYLTYKAKQVGYDPKVILAGRKVNDKMGEYVALQFDKELRKDNIDVKSAKILIMGLTFKENCSDIRNSGVSGVIKTLQNLKYNMDLYDPLVDGKEIKKLYNIYPLQNLKQNMYDGIIVVVAHNYFKKMGLKVIKKLCKKNHIIYDLKYLFKKDEINIRL
ncbi:nucleotide sugar dehydrogenase [bacterium]|nr:nucleotide sugar dehydrogenase [bacterium]